MKPEELRLFSRYRVFLPVELHSADAAMEGDRLPPLRFVSESRDVSLGGLLVDLKEKAKGLDSDWNASWFRERYFWIHLKGIPNIPEGIFAKARAVRMIGEDQTHPEAVGLEFQNLVRPIQAKLKDFLENLTSERQT